MKSKLIKLLQESIAKNGDGRVFKDLDVGDDVVLVREVEDGPFASYDVESNDVIL